MPTQKMLRPDSKGRITLGHLADGVSGFAVSFEKPNRIILVPYTEIPAQEEWLYNNKVALAQVKRGLKDAKEGKIKSRGSFAKYSEESDKKEEK
jgi:hypothetical protein